MAQQKLPNPQIAALPTARALKEFNEALPGSGERILAVFERAIEHSQKMEQQAQEARIRLASRGQIFGLVIGLAAITAGAITGSLGSEWAGSAIGGGGVIGLVSVFVLGKMPWRKKEESAE
jgi:uncharacterized membrane protein